jgi:hypothetical protein
MPAQTMERAEILPEKKVSPQDAPVAPSPEGTTEEYNEPAMRGDKIACVALLSGAVILGIKILADSISGLLR